MARDARPCQPSGSLPLWLKIRASDNLKGEPSEQALVPRAGVSFRVFLTRDDGYTFDFQPQPFKYVKTILNSKAI